MVEKILSRSLRLICSSSFAAAGLGLVAMPAIGQTVAPAETKVMRVEITGSNFKRVDAETALPVTVVTRAEIAASGVQNTEELLAQITSVSSAGSVNNAAVSGLATYGNSTVSLRGLGSDKTLVLVDGRRLALFAGGGTAVNINSIPLGAIERVEVLQDGASGVYGSDAISGVINFILRKDYKGLEITLDAGRPTQGGGAESKKFEILGGFGDYDKDRYAFTGSISYDKENNLLGGSRPFSKSDTNLPYYEGGATETGRIEGTWLFPGGATLTDAGKNARSALSPYGITGTTYGNPSAANGTCAALGMIPRSGKGYTSPFGAAVETRNAPNCGFDTGPFVSLVPNRKFIGGTFNSRFKVSEDVQIYVDGIISQNTSLNPIQPAPQRQAFTAGNSLFEGSGVDSALLIYPQNPNYKFAADYLNSVGLGAMVGKPLAVSQRAFIVGPRTTNDIAEQNRLVIGSKGTIGSLDYDVAYMKNTSHTKGNVVDGFASIFGLHKVLNDPTSNWNPWAPLGKQTPELQTKIDKIKYVGPTIDSRSTNDGVDAKVQGSFMQLGGGQLGLSAGLQARDEAYDLTPAPVMATGDLLGQGTVITEVHAKRTVWALFTEAYLPFTKSFDTTLAVRQDNYSDFGGTINYKLSSRLQAADTAVIRASYGTGFKAPSLVALFTPQSLGTTEQFIDPKFPGSGNIQVASLSGGNPALKPEKSKQFSLGVVLSPIKQFSATFDYFNINITDLIATPSALQIITGFRAGQPAYAGLVTLAPSGEVSKILSLSANVSSVKTSGLDIDLRYREKVSGGRLDIGLNGSYVHKYDLINTAGVVEHSVGTIVNETGGPLVSSALGVILKWKHNLNVGYTYGPYSATITQRFHKGYETAYRADGETKNFIPNTSYFDIVANYSVMKNLKLSLGVRNMFDKAPSVYIGNGNQFQAGYDVSMYDPRGRFVYGQVNYKF